MVGAAISRRCNTSADPEPSCTSAFILSELDAVTTIVPPARNAHTQRCDDTRRWREVHEGHETHEAVFEETFLRVLPIFVIFVPCRELRALPLNGGGMIPSGGCRVWQLATGCCHRHASHGS